MTDATGATIWYRDTLRWGQTNLTEIDPVRYDNDWWREHWRRTRIQGVIVNAGGIVAYYPSALDLQHRAEFLGEHDLLGEITKAARAEGLRVIARMDSNRADERFYLEHPDWFTVDVDGTPYRAGDLFIACVNSPYYDEFVPAILEEVISNYRPDGFADNSWSGLQRDRICHCVHCRRAFRERFGASIPTHHDWDDPIYRQWIRWNYDRRLEIWDRNNEITKRAGGEHCLWIGMNAGDLIAQGNHFRDYRGIAERTELIFLDSQYRHPGMGFQRNGETGQLIHGILGWDKLIPESMAMYGAGQPSFRLASKAEPDARLWALDGFAGDIQPWWHHIGAYHEDRRQYRTAEPLFSWHQQHEVALVDREPVATVGVVWSQENVDYYGRSRPHERFRLPWNGLADALIRARIPYLPIHADHIARDSARFGLKALVLPNVGLLTDMQAASIRTFVAAGGGLLATGESSLYTGAGERRDDFLLADLFGAHATGTHHGADSDDRAAWDQWEQHSYLRIAPERRRWVDGPATGAEPDDDRSRHAVFDGFEDTDILPFGGRLEVVHAGKGVDVPLTLVPPFPIYPPETSWMRHPRSGVPALVLNDNAGGRVAYLPADIDRTFGRSRLPDHARFLANLVRWVASNEILIEIEGAGFLHVMVYRQTDCLVIHLVNLSGHEQGLTPVAEYLPIGPLQVTVNCNEFGSNSTVAQLLVAGTTTRVSANNSNLRFTLERIADHEVAVIPM